MKSIRTQFNRVADFIDDNCELILSTSQMIMAGIMMLCVLILVIVNLFRGCITSFLGIIVALVFTYLIYCILRLSVQEWMQAHKK